MGQQRVLLPLLVLVSGAPGAGKSTFARKLAERMSLQHIDRDVFCQSIAYTRNGAIDKGREAVPMYYDSLEYLLRQGVSLVTDGTLYRDKSEKDVRAHWLPVACVVNVHCRAKDEHKRFYEREVSRAGGEPEWLPAHMNTLKEIYEDTVDPVDLGCPVIEVDSNDEYTPTINQVATQIEDIYAKGQSGQLKSSS